MFSAGWHATVVRHILARLQLMPDMHRAISSLHHHRRLRGRAAYHHRRRKTLHGSGEKRQPDNDDFEEGFHRGECSIRRLPVSRRQSHNSMVLAPVYFWEISIKVRNTSLKDTSLLRTKQATSATAQTDS